MTLIHELWQNDSDTMTAILRQNGAAIDLTSAVVTFVLKNQMGVTVHTIPCNPGATIDDAYVSPAEGAVTVPLSATITATVGYFYGVFKVSLFGEISTVPSSKADMIVILING